MITTSLNALKGHILLQQNLFKLKNYFISMFNVKFKKIYKITLPKKKNYKGN